jgi:hypothetical protein
VPGRRATTAAAQAAGRHSSTGTGLLAGPCLPLDKGCPADTGPRAAGRGCPADTGRQTGTRLERAGLPAASRPVETCGGRTSLATAASAPSCPTWAPGQAREAAVAQAAALPRASLSSGAPMVLGFRPGDAASRSPERTAGWQAAGVPRNPGRAHPVTVRCLLMTVLRSRHPRLRIAARSRHRTACRAPLDTHKTGTSYPSQPLGPFRCPEQASLTSEHLPFERHDACQSKAERPAAPRKFNRYPQLEQGRAERIRGYSLR